jgi:hypothetical protein
MRWGIYTALQIRAFIQSHPVKYPNADDFEPDGTFYSITSFFGQLYN